MYAPLAKISFFSQGERNFKKCSPDKKAMFKSLKEKGFEVLALHHAEAILTHDMPEAVKEIESVFSSTEPNPSEDLIAKAKGPYATILADPPWHLLFGVKGSMRTLQAGRTQVNLFSTRKREHSRKPDEIFDIIERCSPGPYLELFARFARSGWHQWGNEDVEENSLQGVAWRNGHGEKKKPKQIRLFESPKGCVAS